MKTLSIITGHNRAGVNPKTGHPWADATGAFIPEGNAFVRLHGGTRCEIASPVPPVRRRKLVEDAILGEPGLGVLAVFGHGTPRMLAATGHGIPGGVNDLAGAIKGTCRRDDSGCVTAEPISIILYACLTARGEIGFADLLADVLPWASVWAHSTAGHSTWNPFVELAGGPCGGDPVFRPRDGHLWKRWRERLREDQVFRLSFWVPAHGLPRSQALDAVRAGL